MSPSARTVVTQDPLIKAVIANLTYSTFIAYDSGAPGSAAFPYTVVYSLDDFDRSGPMWDGQSDAVHTIQATAVGETAEQARLLQDANRAQMLLVPMTVAGRALLLVDEGETGSVERDDDEQPSLFYAIQLWLITTTVA